MKTLYLSIFSLLIIFFYSASPLHSQTIDAAIQLDSRTYLFKDSLYYRFTWPDQGLPKEQAVALDENYPRTLPGGWQGLKGQFLEKIDAALFYRPSEKSYFFSGDEYLRLSGVKVDSGYPKKLPGGWKGLPEEFHSDIDAAVFWNDRSYFFKGDKYVRFSGLRMDEGYPRELPGGWKFEMPFSEGVDAAFDSPRGQFNHFFSGERYTVLDGVNELSGFPYNIFVSWPGIPSGRDDLPDAWRTTDVVDSRIDEYAQYALMRMFRGSVSERITASTLLGNVKFEKLFGIYVVDQEVAAKRALDLGKSWWTVLPKGVHAKCLMDSNGENPIIVFSKEARANKALLDQALESARGNCQLETIPFFGYLQNLPVKQKRDETCDEGAANGGGLNVFVTVDGEEADASFEYLLNVTKDEDEYNVINHAGPRVQLSFGEGFYSLEFRSESGYFAFRNTELQGSCLQNLHVDMVAAPDGGQCASDERIQAEKACDGELFISQLNCSNSLSSATQDPNCNEACHSAAVAEQNACLLKSAAVRIRCLDEVNNRFGRCE